MVLFEFLGSVRTFCTAIEHFCKRLLLNKLVSFITALKVETKNQVDETGLTEESGIFLKNCGITNYYSLAEL